LLYPSQALLSSNRSFQQSVRDPLVIHPKYKLRAGVTLAVNTVNFLCFERAGHELLRREAK
jgi:hypothetical protein